RGSDAEAFAVGLQRRGVEAVAHSRLSPSIGSRCLSGTCSSTEVERHATGLIPGLRGGFAIGPRLRCSFVLPLPGVCDRAGSDLGAEDYTIVILAVNVTFPGQ